MNNTGAGSYTDGDDQHVGLGLVTLAGQQANTAQGLYTDGDDTFTLRAVRTPVVRYAEVKLTGAQVMRGVVSPDSALYFTATFRDRARRLVAPKSLSWALFGWGKSLKAGAIDSRYMDGTVFFEIPPDYDPRQGCCRWIDRQMHMIVTAEYGSTRQITARTDFRVADRY